MAYRKHALPPIDADARRYYVYRLLDNDGACLYVGRSCQPLTRLRQHHQTRGLDWPTRVVQIEAWGPYTWDEACQIERDKVYAEKPLHNRMYVLTHTYREPKLA